MQIDGQTRIVAVLGHPIAHTASPAMHNAAFDALRLNWRYVALDVDPSLLAPALRGLAGAGLAGVNLTVPHKILAMPLLDRVERCAHVLRATNTIECSVVRGKPFLRGHNTDGYGLLKALQEEFAFRWKGRTVAVVGCGGAGQGAAVQLALAGVKRLVLLNRTPSKARAIARHLRSLRLRTECGFKLEPCDLVIQATSLGLRASDALPVSPADLKRLNPCYFFDMIYRPSETPALRLARRMGCRVANGLGMLLHQGAMAFEIWTHRKAPVEVMRRALKREVYGR